MGHAETRAMIKLLAEGFNEEKRDMFQAYGEGGRYTKRQKDYAFELTDEYGIRATARILQIPRRTLQRWCRKNYVWVKRCPSWVYGWVERRRKRKEFWRR
jgi:hypothetical protein